jgi:predicted DNA-binding transcriptional regulator AlpA
MSERLLKPSEVADRLGMSVAALKRWRMNGSGPDYIKISRNTVRYRPEAVEQYLESLQEVA